METDNKALEKVHNRHLESIQGFEWLIGLGFYRKNEKSNG